MIRHMFPGGNTPNGFFSYFENIMPFKDAKRNIFIKGGSGTGKSTFMRRIGTLFDKRGLDLEYFHCSNDPESLDGICIPKLGISIVDATAPHIQDPVAPIAVDEILNLAEFLDEGKIKKYTEELKLIIPQKKDYSKKAYRYLNAAYQLYENNQTIYERALNPVLLNASVYDLLNDLFDSYKTNMKIGNNRKLFLSAITPDGYINYINETLSQKKIYILLGQNSYSMDYMLKKIQEEANNHGFDTEGFYSPLNPKQLEHLTIPSMDIAFSVSNLYHSINKKPIKIIDFNEFCHIETIDKSKDELDYNTKIFEELLQKSMNTMKDSKVLHNRIEEIYVSNMDFERLSKVYDKVSQSLCDLI